MASSNSKKDRRPILAHVERLNQEEAARQEAAMPKGEEAQPANETQETTTEAHEYDLSGSSDAELSELLSACLAEIKLRKEAAANLLPKVGAPVQVTSGKWKGKVGTLIHRGKTKCHVRLDDTQFPLPAYVSMTDVVVQNDAAS